MKTTVILFSVFLLATLLTGFIPTGTDDQKSSRVQNFYQMSLHATNKGIGFIYSKEHGGLERLTGLPADAIGCYKSKCHAVTCDDCHLKETEGNKIYTSDSATLSNACKRCHGDMAADNPDVHFSKGMTCMNCHTSREIHGDGKEHNTYMEPGFFDVSCKKCHVTVTASESHTMHGDKLDCITCHSYEYTTCLNCHIGSRMEGGKDVQFPLKDMTFLVNHNGKITLANMLSYVYKGKTMITFAKTFSHSIKKDGRKCPECHNSDIVKGMNDNTFRLARWEKDTLTGSKGVIPVLEGYNWNLVFLDRVNGKWMPLANPPEPLLNYSGYCTPISRTQFESMLKSY